MPCEMCVNCGESWWLHSMKESRCPVYGRGRNRLTFSKTSVYQVRPRLQQTSQIKNEIKICEQN